MYRLELVLRDDPDPDDPNFFEEVMGAVESLSPAGWNFDIESEESQLDGSVQIIWVEQLMPRLVRKRRLARQGSFEGRKLSRTVSPNPDDLATITLFKDQPTALCTIAVSAPRSGDVKIIAESLEEHLDIVGLDELLEQARSGLALNPELLVKIALTAGEKEDPETAELIRKALEHRFPQVRYYAAYAAALTLWPVFIPELERLLKLEPDRDVEEMAQRALAGCDRELNAAARR